MSMFPIGSGILEDHNICFGSSEECLDYSAGSRTMCTCAISFSPDAIKFNSNLYFSLSFC